MKRFAIVLIAAMLCLVATGCSTAANSSTSTGQNTAENYQSSLPIISINTEGAVAITSKDKYLDATADINGKDGGEQQYSGAIKIRGRGNSSWNEFPKKGYKIKLDSSTSLYGMDKGKEWALLPDYLDESLMRTKFNTGVAKDMGLLTMDGTWVVLFINGEYRGVYELTEQVKIGENSVDIFDWEDEAENIAEAIYKAEKTLTDDDAETMADDMIETMTWMTSGKVTYKHKTYTIANYYKMHSNLNEGYLCELSEEYDETTRFKTSTSHLSVMVKSPEYLAYNETAMNNLKKIWNEWDEAIHSKTGYSSNGVYYADLMDLESAVDYWLMSEFTVNGEAVKKSRYVYIGSNGKLTFGPVWDFDYCLDPSKKTLSDWGWTSEVGDFDDTTGWKICTSDNEQNIFDALITHEDFLDLAYERYTKVMKPSISTNLDKLSGYYDYLHDEGTKNTETWKFDRGFEEDYNVLTEFIKERYDWMNSTFESKDTFLSSLK